MDGHSKKWKRPTGDFSPSFLFWVSQSQQDEETNNQSHRSMKNSEDDCEAVFREGLTEWGKPVMREGRKARNCCCVNLWAAQSLSWVGPSVDLPYLKHLLVLWEKEEKLGIRDLAWFHADPLQHASTASSRDVPCKRSAESYRHSSIACCPQEN